MPQISWDQWETIANAFWGETLDVPPPSDEFASPPPMITVFGAGIAGLSAAHELIDRGFGVQVVASQLLTICAPR